MVGNTNQTLSIDNDTNQTLSIENETKRAKRPLGKNRKERRLAKEIKTLQESGKHFYQMNS